MRPLWEEVTCGLFLMHGTVCVYAQPLRNGMSPGRDGPYGELFFFLLEKEPMVLRDLSPLGPSIRPHGELHILSTQKKRPWCETARPSTPTSGMVFLIPELKDGSEASKDEQADSSSENNVGNRALFVIGLHGSGDVIDHFLQDWEVAKVACARSCMTSKGGAAGSASERVLFFFCEKGKEANDCFVLS